MIELECPACENMLAIQEDQLGGYVLCPHCNVQLDLTDAGPEEQPAQAPQPTASRKRVVIKKKAPLQHSPSGPRTQQQPQSQQPRSQQPQSQQPQSQQPQGQVHMQSPGPSGPRGPMPVRLVSVDLTIGQMVVLILKLTVASIPAMIIIYIVTILLVFLFAQMFAGLFGAASMMTQP